MAELEEITILSFAAAPYDKPLRYRKNWWHRTSYHVLTDIKSSNIFISFTGSKLNTLVAAKKTDL